MDLLNRVMLVGNLTRDPEVRETGNGKAVANLSLAVDPPGGIRDRGDGTAPTAETVFVDVVLWERLAENASQYLQRGSQVLIEGRLRMESWKDRESGQTRRKLKIAGERLRFMGTAPGDDEGGRSRPTDRRRETARSR